VDIRHGGHTKIKNNDHSNLSLCPCGFLVALCLNFFCQKNKDFACNIIASQIEDAPFLGSIEDTPFFWSID
jgi:hypothetical protein